MAEFAVIVWLTALFVFGPVFVIACLVAGTMGAIYGVVVMFQRISARRK